VWQARVASFTRVVDRCEALERRVLLRGGIEAQRPVSGRTAPAVSGRTATAVSGRTTSAVSGRTATAVSGLYGRVAGRSEKAEVCSFHILTSVYLCTAETALDWSVYLCTAETALDWSVAVRECLCIYNRTPPSPSPPPPPRAIREIVTFSPFNNHC